MTFIGTDKINNMMSRISMEIAAVRDVKEQLSEDVYNQLINGLISDQHVLRIGLDHTAIRNVFEVRGENF